MKESTKKMTFLFSQYEVERRLYTLLEYGDETEVAERVGRSSSFISQMFNPEDERQSDIYKALCQIAALKDIDPYRGRAMQDMFNHFCNRHGEPTEKGHETLFRRSLHGEYGEYLESVIAGQDVDEQIRQLEEAISAAERLLRVKRAKASKANVTRLNGTK